MLPLDTFVSETIVESVGWALLHFVWQGAAIALLCAAALWLLRNRRASLRHGVAVAALLACILAPVGTAWWIHTSSLESASVNYAAHPVDPAPSQAATVHHEHAFSAPDAESATPPRSELPLLASADALAPYLPYLVLMWAVGATVLALRLVRGWRSVRRLRNKSWEAPAPWPARMEAWAHDMGLSTTVSLQCVRGIQSPMVVGWWRPVILVPLGVLSGWTPHQVEVVLRHELAHIQHNDMVINALQRAAETLLFFHPGVWWISAQITREREWRCDDMALTGDRAQRIAYATALSSLAEPNPTWSMAASDGSLLTRIRRILSPNCKPATFRPQWTLAFATLLLAGTIGLAACSTSESATEAPSDPLPPASSEAQEVPTPQEAPTPDARESDEPDSSAPPPQPLASQTPESFFDSYQAWVDTLDIEAFMEQQRKQRKAFRDSMRAFRAQWDTVDQDSLRKQWREAIQQAREQFAQIDEHPAFADTTDWEAWIDEHSAFADTTDWQAWLQEHSAFTDTTDWQAWIQEHSAFADTTDWQAWIQEHSAFADTTDWEAWLEEHRENMQDHREHMRQFRKDMQQFRENMRQFREQEILPDTTDWDSVRQAHREHLRLHRDSLRAHRDRMRVHRDSLRVYRDSLRNHRDRMREKRE